MCSVFSFTGVFCFSCFASSLHRATDFIHHNNASGSWSAFVECPLMCVTREASVVEINMFKRGPQASERLPLALWISWRIQVAANSCSTPAKTRQSGAASTVSSPRLNWASVSEEWVWWAAAWWFVVPLCSRGARAQVASFLSSWQRRTLLAEHWGWKWR